MEKKRNGICLKSVLNLKSVKRKVLQVFLLQTMLLYRWGVMAQEQKVTIHLKQVKVQEIFKEINKQTGLNFVYSAMQLNEIGMVSLNVKDVTVDFVLKKLFEGKPFTYKFEMQSIIIRKIEAMPKEKTSRTIRGVITDKAKEPLPGVTVLLKGTSVGTASNMPGRVCFRGNERCGSLIVTFVGMKTQYVKLQPEVSMYKIQMEYDVEEMDEVVITGYQTIDKRKNTSAVQTLQMDDIKVPGVTRVDQLLEGHVPGMTFMQNSGQVGAAPKLRVRGTSTVLGKSRTGCGCWMELYYEIP